MPALGFLLLSSVATFLLYPRLINFLYRFQVREEINPDAPRTHTVKQGTPTAAGILPLLVFLILNLFFNLTPQTAVLLGVVVALGLLGFLQDLSKIYHRSLLRSFVRGKITPLVTFSDLSWNIYKLALLPWRTFKEIFRALGSSDVGEIHPYQKILFQTAVGGLLVLWLVLNAKVDLSLLYFPLVLLEFVFLVNSVSVTDGLDGLVGGLLAIGFTALMVIALTLGFWDLAVAAGILVGGLLPFLYFNIYPARIFAGNVGALGWAGAFVALGLLLGQEWNLLVIGGVFVLEGLSVVLQVASVKMGRGRIFLMAPLHHHFEMKGWAETKVTMRFWLAGAFLAFLGLYLALR